MRAKVGLYRDPGYDPSAAAAARASAMTDSDDEDGGEGLPQVGPVHAVTIR